MIAYRKTTPDDAEVLSEVRGEFLTEANGGEIEPKALTAIKKECRDYFVRALSDGSFIAWVAEDDGEVVATSGICFYSVPPNKSCPNGSVAYIQNMYTKKDYRRQGIARNLFIKIMEDAKARGCTKVLLNATDMGRPLYEKFGFKDVKGDMAYYI